MVYVVKYAVYEIGVVFQVKDGGLDQLCEFVAVFRGGRRVIFPAKSVKDIELLVEKFFSLGLFRGDEFGLGRQTLHFKTQYVMVFQQGI